MAAYFAKKEYILCSWTKIRKISERVLRFIVEYNSNQAISYTKGYEGKAPPRQTTKRSVSGRVDLETDLNKIGSYLLSHLIGSTIGVDGLNFSVRDGKRWNTVALAT